MLLQEEIIQRKLLENLLTGLVFTDTLHARDIHKKFGEIELKTFPMRYF